jgi:hypothetical protein
MGVLAQNAKVTPSVVSMAEVGDVDDAVLRRSLLSSSAQLHLE